MNVSFNFTEQVVIITGAARGIGREMTRQFVHAGANVVAVDRDHEGLVETITDLPTVQIATCIADITSETDCVRIGQTAIDQFGRLDICVNNAAVAPHASLLDERVSVWDRVYAVNCRGTFLMTQTVARIMIDQRHGGRIINFSSGVVQRGSPGAATYASSRAAVESFTRVAAIELAAHNILVNAISPGLIDTQPKPLPPHMASSLSRRIPTLPLARPGDPAEVAATVMFLASDGASYITGSTISVDGGSGVGSRFEGAIIDDDPRYDWVTERVTTEASAEMSAGRSDGIH